MSEKDQFYHDVFVTALEGGIGYWSECSEYRWSYGPPKFVPNFQGFHAVITEYDDDETHRIDRDVIVKAFSILRAVLAETHEGDIGLHDDYVMDLLRAYRSNDAGEIDAGLADCIVQLGLFGKVIYG